MVKGGKPEIQHAVTNVMFQYCQLGRLSHEVGWKYQQVVRTLETKRKVKMLLRMRRIKSLRVSWRNAPCSNCPGSCGRLTKIWGRKFYYLRLKILLYDINDVKLLTYIIWITMKIILKSEMSCGYKILLSSSNFIIWKVAMNLTCQCLFLVFVKISNIGSVELNSCHFFV